MFSCQYEKTVYDMYFFSSTTFYCCNYANLLQFYTILYIYFVCVAKNVLIQDLYTNIEKWQAFIIVCVAVCCQRVVSNSVWYVSINTFNN